MRPLFSLPFRRTNERVGRCLHVEAAVRAGALVLLLVPAGVDPSPRRSRGSIRLNTVTPTVYWEHGGEVSIRDSDGWPQQSSEYTSRARRRRLQNQGDAGV
jgi:hypothetical protein